MMERIGFIGLGLIGKPMARNLLKAGYTVAVFNRSRAAMDELAQEGATVTASPKDVAERSDVVITALPDSPDVEDVLTRADGVFAGARPGMLLIDMGTISPLVSQTLAQQAVALGIDMLDAPVSGGDVGAREGTLSIMVGGEAHALDRARPIFDVLGKTITHCGGHGAGQVVKACNQIVVAGVIEAIGEALVLGSKAGVKPETIVQVLSGGLAQTRVMDLRGAKMARRDFEPGGKARFHHKDLGIALQVARAYGVPLPMTSLVDQMFAAVIENGFGDKDHSSLMTVLEAMAHHQVGDLV
jgi:2-hydroxy-3-oxopropionate reductase